MKTWTQLVKSGKVFSIKYYSMCERIMNELCAPLIYSSLHASSPFRLSQKYERGDCISSSHRSLPLSSCRCICCNASCSFLQDSNSFHCDDSTPVQRVSCTPYVLHSCRSRSCHPFCSFVQVCTYGIHANSVSTALWLSQPAQLAGAV